MRINVRVRLDSFDYAQPAEKQTQVYVELEDVARATYLLPADRYNALRDAEWGDVLDVAHAVMTGWVSDTGSAAARAAVRTWLAVDENRDLLNVAWFQDRAQKDPVSRSLMRDKTRLLAENERLTALVAAMHAASVGETRPPLLGYVEDVAITRSAFLAQQHRADALEGIARREQTWRQRYETENGALKAQVAELQSAKTRLSAVLDLCDSEQRGAMRWENPLPVPEWVAVVQRIALGDAAPAEVAPATEAQAPAADSPAARLAAELRDSQPDVVLTEVIDPNLLRLHVRPISLACWRWWLDHLAVDVGSITHKGGYATCRGSYADVRVLMAGFGVGDLQAAARPDAEAGERA